MNPQYFSDEGGIHLTSHAYLPNALLKELSATEDQFYSGIVNVCYKQSGIGIFQDPSTLVSSFPHHWSI